ncbi:MAG TPA: serine/threonine-protein kinase, partial [Polyangiaceae bacterium]
MNRDSSPPTGRRFGDYRVVRLLARGGMGHVYEAEHVPSGRVVALKLPDASTSNDATALRRFRAEGKLLDTVRHPNIVRVFEVGVEADCPYIVMELLRGETLRAKVERQGPLSRAEVVELFLPICEAIASLHDSGIVHRDLKLCNVMLTARSGKLVPMILDFGISKDLVANGAMGVQTQSGAFVGTPRYLSPEQTLNPKTASPLSDQYAAGIMLYECLTGRSPFAGEAPYALMHAILTAPVIPPSQLEPRVDQGLDAIVLRAMHRDPNERFPSVRALARALREQVAVPERISRPPERTSVLPERATGGRASGAPPSSGSAVARLGRAAEVSTTVPSGTLNRAPTRIPPSSRSSAAAEPAVPAPLLPSEPFHEVRLLEPQIVLVRRSSRKFVDAAEVAEERRRVGAALDQLGRRGKRLLVDSRRAPLSTDELLTNAFMALREEIGRNFERTAVVVDTKIGILQANRLNRAITFDGAIAAF